MISQWGVGQPHTEGEGMDEMREAFIKKRLNETTLTSVRCANGEFLDTRDQSIWKWIKWACKWQIEQDAKICEKEAKYGNPHATKSAREMYEYGAEACANRIKDQKYYEKDNR